jgi:hypothetical protein
MINEIHVILHVIRNFTAQLARGGYVTGRLKGAAPGSSLAGRAALESTPGNNNRVGKRGTRAFEHAKHQKLGTGGQVVDPYTGLTVLLALLTTRLRVRQAERGLHSHSSELLSQGAG